MSSYLTSKIRTFSAGGLYGALLLLAMQRRGMYFPWLLIVVTGMVLASQMLTLCALYQQGLIKPWKR